MRWQLVVAAARLGLLALMATAAGCGHPLKTDHRADAGVGGADGAASSAAGSIGTSVAGTSGSGGSDAAVATDAFYGEPDVPVGGTAGGGGGTMSSSGGTGAGSSGGVSTGTGGSGTSADGSSGGSSGGSGTSADGNSGGSSGGSGTSADGSSGDSGADGSDDDLAGTDSAGCPVATEMISDFESGQGDMIPQGSPRRSGWWYVYYPGSPGAMAAGQKQTPAFNPSGPIAVEPAPDASPCNRYALHSTGSGFAPGSRPGSNGPENAVGFGAGFLPQLPLSQVFRPYDVSAYTGIKFKMKAGSGIQQAVYFEMLTQETLSSSQGGLLGSEQGADVAVGLHNNRGQVLSPPWTPNAISSSYQTFTVPFGTLVPRWVPTTWAGPYEATCPTSGTPKCQAPAFNPRDVLAFQVSIYQDDGFPKPAGSTPGTYDLWIDDVEFMTDDSGLQTRPGFPLANPGDVGICIRPQGPSADAKFLVPAYNQWKSTFVSGNRVIRPEKQNDTISEGIAYGMLIAVNMNDQDLFDGLYGFWKDHPVPTTSLMTSCVPGGPPDGGAVTGPPCVSSGGSATGADEDAAYALLMGDKAWGGTYKADALTMITDIWANDIDSAGTKLPKGGSGYGSPTSAVTSPSYFAPAFYRAFAAVDGAHDWAGVIAAVYNVIGGAIAGSNGLIPAWCGSSCTVAASIGSATDGDYQYDSHRIPMRIGLDYCFHSTDEAKAYTKKTTAFFALMAQNGTGFLMDMFTSSGGAVYGSGTNSASMLGTAAVGAMASGNQAFLNDAYQAVFDLLTRGTMAPSIYVASGYGESGSPSPQPTHGYYNATVGMLTLLIMTGNFMH
jgi:endo-1,4-beta-D-glucanase Y